MRVKRSERRKYKIVGDHIRCYVDYNASAGVSEEQYYLPRIMVESPTIITAPPRLMLIYEDDNRMEP